MLATESGAATPLVLKAARDGVLTLTLNRGDRFNPLSSDMIAALPGVNIGVFCSTPAVGVVRNIGRKRTMEMLLTGHTIDAQTALAWGLVNRVVPAEELDTEIRRLTDVIIARSPAAIALGKRAFYDQIDRPLADAYARTSEAMACNTRLDDAAEGMDAFLSRRPPRWSGR